MIKSNKCYPLNRMTMMIITKLISPHSISPLNLSLQLCNLTFIPHKYFRVNMATYFSGFSTSSVTKLR